MTSSHLLFLNPCSFIFCFYPPFLFLFPLVRPPLSCLHLPSFFPLFSLRTEDSSDFHTSWISSFFIFPPFPRFLLEISPLSPFSFNIYPPPTPLWPTSFNPNLLPSCLLSFFFSHPCRLSLPSLCSIFAPSFPPSLQHISPSRLEQGGKWMRRDCAPPHPTKHHRHYPLFIFFSVCFKFLLN